MENRADQRIRAIYTGRVQGVGFRMTVCELARPLPVVGRVVNVSDGTVELIAQGEAETLSQLLDSVDRRLGRYIVQGRVEWLAGVPGEYSGFSIGPDKWVKP